jgi:hypothetical protein
MTSVDKKENVMSVVKEEDDDEEVERFWRNYCLPTYTPGTSSTTEQQPSTPDQQRLSITPALPPIVVNKEKTMQRPPTAMTELIREWNQMLEELPSDQTTSTLKMKEFICDYIELLNELSAAPFTTTPLTIAALTTLDMRVHPSESRFQNSGCLQ